jgi:Abortive infection C-terminus
LGQALITATQAVAELRNSDGTGHGRSKRSDLDPTHAHFVREMADVWCRWLLATAQLTRLTELDGFIDDIGGPLVLRQGMLPRLLQDLPLGDLSEEDQRRVGLAVARRWSVNDTFLPLTDVIEPIARGEADYPPAFCEGAMEGLLIDHNGSIRISGKDDVRTAVNVVLNLPGARRHRVLQELADRLEDARPSYKFSAAQRQRASRAWRELADEQHDPWIHGALNRIAERFEKLSRSSAPDST